MGKYEKILIRILSGASDRDIDFDDLCYVLKLLDFNERIKGSHHIFYKEGIPDIINIQPKDSKAKPYQVKQVRGIITRYKLGGMLDV